MLCLTYLWFLLDVPFHECFTLGVVQDDDLDAVRFEQVFAANPVGVFPDYDTGYLVEQDGACAHDTGTIQKGEDDEIIALEPSIHVATTHLNVVYCVTTIDIIHPTRV